MSNINIYSNKWELEGQFNTIDEVVEEWLVEEGEVEEALDQLTLINNRYIVYEDDLGKQLHLISQVIEDGLLDVLGDSLDKEDERLVKYQVELKQEVERSSQYKHDFDTVSRKYMTIVHEQEQLLTKVKELDEQLHVSTTNHQNALQTIDKLTKDNKKLTRELDSTGQILRQVEAVLRGEPEHSSEVRKQQSRPIEPEPQSEAGVDDLIRDGAITDDMDLSNNLVESEEVDESYPIEDTGNNTKGKSKKVEGTKKVLKARVKWDQVLQNPSFPLLTDLKNKKFWHLSELSSKLSKPPRSIITESDLDFIVHKVFTKVGYKKEMPNPKLLNTQEATWIILAAYYNSDKSLVGLERLTKSVEVLYDDWYTNREIIYKTLKQG